MGRSEGWPTRLSLTNSSVFLNVAICLLIETSFNWRSLRVCWRGMGWMWTCGVRTTPICQEETSLFNLQCSCLSVQYLPWIVQSKSIVPDESERSKSENMDGYSESEKFCSNNKTVMWQTKVFSWPLWWSIKTHQQILVGVALWKVWCSSSVGWPLSTGVSPLHANLPSFSSPTLE